MGGPMRFLFKLQKMVEAFFATLESIWISMFERVATWTAPIPSAITVTYSAVSTLQMAWLWGACIALALEGIGIIASYSYLQAKEWNVTKKKSEPEADESIGRNAITYYVIIAEIMIVVFELKKIIENSDPWGLTALPLPFLTIIMIRLGAERIVHNQRIMQREEASTVTKTSSGVNKFDSKLNTLLGHYLNNPNLTPTEASRLMSCSRTTIYNYLDVMQQRGMIENNGEGVRILQ